MPDTLETNFLNPSTPLEREVAEMGPWFHNLHLPEGTETAPNHPLGDFPAFKWEQMASCLPDDLSGWSVLDVGCNAGFYSIALARRGASVTAIDINDRYLEQARWAVQQCEVSERVTVKKRQVYDLARHDESYDLILFLGVLYHLRYPLLALDLVAERTRRLMMFQSLSLPDKAQAPAAHDRSINDREALMEPGWPKMAFIEDRFAGDPTNWWVPNPTAIEAMLRSCGMRITGQPGDEIYLCEPDPAAQCKIPAFVQSQQQAATGRGERTS